jgi:DNA helicase-2/ATP-dependent DNA helicase PcrA
MNFEWSPFQNKIINHIQHRRGSLFIEAVAGSSKTTCLVEAAKYLPVNESIFLAFNRHIKEELEKKLPIGFTVKTMNALGHGAWMSHVNERVQVDAEKVFKIIEELASSSDDRYRFIKLAGCIKKLVDLAKNNGLVPDVPEFTELKSFTTDRQDIWLDMLENFSIDDKIREFAKDDEAYFQECKKFVVEKAREVLIQSTKVHNVIDFNDQLYLPLVYRARFKKYNFVLADEAQDFNVLQLEMIKKVGGLKTQVYGVGDPRQAIYQFRGADSESVEKFKAHFKCQTLELPICYRCPVLVVKEANQINSLIQPWEKAETGIVADIKANYSMESFIEGDMILSRFNAPLLILAMRLLEANKKISFAGRDIQQELFDLVESFNCLTVGDLLCKVENWKKEKLDRIERRGTYQDKAQIMDKYYSIVVLAKRLKSTDSPRNIFNEISSSFKNYGGIVLSTVHKAKGLEATNVWLLDRDKMSSTDGLVDGDSEAERNILYVALTRAKKALYFIESPEEFRSEFYNRQKGGPKSELQLRVNAAVHIRSGDHVGEVTKPIFDQLNNKHAEFFNDEEFIEPLPVGYPSIHGGHE